MLVSLPEDHADLNVLGCLLGWESLEVVLGKENGTDNSEAVRTGGQLKRGRGVQDKARGGRVVHEGR